MPWPWSARQPLRRYFPPRNRRPLPAFAGIIGSLDGARQATAVVQSWLLGDERALPALLDDLDDYELRLLVLELTRLAGTLCLAESGTPERVGTPSGTLAWLAAAREITAERWSA